MSKVPVILTFLESIPHFLLKKSNFEPETEGWMLPNGQRYLQLHDPTYRRNH